MQLTGRARQSMSTNGKKFASSVFPSRFLYLGAFHFLRVLMLMFDDRGKIFLNAMDMVKCFSTLAAGSLDVLVIFRDAKATVGTLFSHPIRV